ncbi:MAG TPA: ribulose-phosphate 3-epimerase [Thermoleophilaceae bacterium]|nr:ribulose-phosphate 3-epimerase [Thermoleophilaceae bacterium]
MTADSDSSRAAELLRETRVAPSILPADYARLSDQVEAIMTAGARVVHVDVMDGHFVPPISVGPPIVEAIREQVSDAGGILDVHLMIEHPERQVEEFAKAGADIISIHQEATPHVHFTLERIHDAGCLAGLALNPSTPVEAAYELGDLIDLLLCMTVNPGWGGQSFIEASLSKVERLRSQLPAGVPVEVDGGIAEETAPRCVEAGATVLVTGSAVMGSDDPAESYRSIAAAAGAS